MSRHRWVLNRRSCSCRRVIDLLYFDGRAWKGRVREKETERCFDEAWLTAAWRQCFTVSQRSLRSLFHERNSHSPFPHSSFSSYFCLLLSVHFSPCPYFHTSSPLSPLLFDTFQSIFFALLWIHYKAVARSERPALLSALSELQDPIKLLIRPFRRLRPPTALIIHPKTPKPVTHSLLFRLFFCFSALHNLHIPSPRHCFT